LIKKKADAKAYEIRTITNALKDVGVESSSPVVYDAGEIQAWSEGEDRQLELKEGAIDSRATKRIDHQERKQQENIESVTAEAAMELTGEEDVADKHPDEDWVNRFFSSAQDVSSGEMQTLWGRILAGEIKKPGSYSLRTLEFLRNVTTNEATIFEGLAKLAVNISGGTAVIPVDDKGWLQKERKVYSVDHFQLSELGLMYPNELQFKAFRDKSIKQELLLIQDHIIVVERNEIKAETPMPIWKFTDIGRELLTLIKRPLDMEYLEKISEFFVKKKARVRIAKILEHLSNGQVRFDVLKELIEQDSSGNG
jgi:hypothetical protein